MEGKIRHALAGTTRRSQGGRQSQVPDVLLEKDMSKMTEKFWQALDSLVEQHEIIIDRPKGTPHPRHPDLIYPLDYGYLKETRSGDGGGIDVWIGSLPERKIVAGIVAVDLTKKAIEIKVLLGCKDEEKQMVLQIHQKGMQSALLVERH
jgi:inorganic pyrophosphatase